MKIFLSGKISGDKGYREKFHKKEKELLGMGYFVMNPAILPDGFRYEDYIRICFSMINACDGIYLLKDYKESRGSRGEKIYAENNNLQIIYEK